jgi:hexosaminidase
MNSINRFIILGLLVCNAIGASGQLSIIPLPKSIKETDASFSINSRTKIYYQDGLKPQAELLSAALSPAAGFDFQVLKLAGTTATNAIILKQDKSLSANREAYKLSIKTEAITLSGGGPAGIFYGTQTMLQMLPAVIYNQKRQKNVSWQIRGADIEDAPLWAWRGMMLDVARYFFSKEYVLKFIDMMAMYKMNTLHLHLVDDAGWRLEIKKYPKLTSIGAWRGEGAERTGGYYTQEDIREMVAYASQRNVDVIPEIELPAHALASIAAYPELCCTGDQYTVQTQHSISKEIYCAGKESTFEFLNNVFTETFALFPSRYIHIGGDEANYERWKVCPYCQKRKAELGLKTEKELQVYFNKRVQKMVASYGKTIVGWNEIIEDGLEEKVVGMIWNDPKKSLKAVEAGHDVVMTLTGYSYFDVAESNIPGEVKAATWLAPISLEKVYSLNPMLPDMNEKYRKQVLGASAALWSDQFIHSTLLQEIPLLNENRSERYFDYLALPRMAALAEVCWTPLSRQNWIDFEKRMAKQYQCYDQAGYGYRLPQPKLITTDKTPDGYLIKLSNIVDGATIRYTTDGSRPNAYSQVYRQPVVVKKLSDFNAITVVNRNVYSLPLSFPEK